MYTRYVRYCEKCNVLSRVVETRDLHKGSVTRRRRECPQCGARFTTYELAGFAVATVEREWNTTAPAAPAADDTAAVISEEIDDIKSEISGELEDIKSEISEQLDGIKSEIDERFDNLPDDLVERLVDEIEARRSVALPAGRPALDGDFDEIDDEDEDD